MRCCSLCGENEYVGTGTVTPGRVPKFLCPCYRRRVASARPLVIASATVNYRDLNMIVGYALNLWMYGSLVIYPRSAVPSNLLWLLTLNPMASLIECYRSSLFGTEHTEVQPAIIATVITLIAVVAGLWCFSKAEGTFTDSI